MYPKKIMYKKKFASALFLWLLLLVGDTEGCATNKIKDPGGWHLCEARIVIIEYWKRPNWGQPRLQQGKLFVKKEKITGQKLWRLLTKIMMAKFLWENIRSCQQEEKEALLNCQIWIICVNTLWISNIVKVDIYSWVYISVNELFQDWIMQMQKRRKRRNLKATTSIKIITLTKRNSLGNWRLNQSLDIVLFAKQEKSKKKWMKVLWINAEHAFITCKHFLSDHGDGWPVQLLPHLRGPAPPWRLLPVLAAPPPPAETRPLTGKAGHEPSQSLKFHNHWEGYWRGIFRDCGNFVDLGFRRGRWCAGARAWRGCRPGARAAASQS